MSRIETGHAGEDAMPDAGDATRDEAGSQAGRDLKTALLRGLRCRCPNCAQGRLFRRFLKSVDRCAVCDQAIYHHRADDLPPYLTIFIVGHVVVALFMGAERSTELSMWAHLAIWVPVTILLSLVLLQPLKGATIGLQWALRQGGFGSQDQAAQEGETARESGSHPAR